TNPIFDDVFKTLLPYYEMAIAELGKVNLERRFWADPFERLAEHIIIAYAYDIGPEAEYLSGRFFKEAPQAYRATAISFAGRAYIARDNFPSGEKRPKISRLAALWEARLKAKASVTELREFGWWVKKGAFKTTWMLEKLEDTLQVTQGDIEAE